MDAGECLLIPSLCPFARLEDAVENQASRRVGLQMPLGWISQEHGDDDLRIFGATTRGWWSKIYSAEDVEALIGSTDQSTTTRR